MNFFKRLKFWLWKIKTPTHIDTFYMFAKFFDQKEDARTYYNLKYSYLALTKDEKEFLKLYHSFTLQDLENIEKAYSFNKN